jgi:hypothetical protein
MPGTTCFSRSFDSWEMPFVRNQKEKFKNLMTKQHGGTIPFYWTGWKLGVMSAK